MVRTLGAGGMGVIYEATHPVLDTRLVIKTLRPELGTNPRLVDRFRTEALAASRLRDERLPQIYDIDQLDDGTWYIAMELLEGEDLDARLRRGALSPRVAVRLVTEVLQVLDKVHRHGIVHRDLKPANLFLARSDLLGVVPKLLDFGVAHMTRDDGGTARDVAGTPHYMAREQSLPGGNIGPWTDIFAIGVVLYECMAGHHIRPWASNDVQGHLSAVRSGAPPRDLASVAPDVPRGLADVVTWTLQGEIVQRCPDAATLLRALEPWCADRAALALLNHSRDGQWSEDGATLGGQQPTSTWTNGAAQPPTEALPEAPVTMSARVVSSRKLAGLRSQLARLKAPTAPAAAPNRARGASLRPGERRLIALTFVETRFDTGGAVLEAEDFDELSQQILDVLASELSEQGADLLPQPGGVLVGVFGYRTLREDDAERAVAAAQGALDRARDANAFLAEVGYTLSVRAGIHRGFVARVGSGQPLDALTGAVAGTARSLASVSAWDAVAVSGPAREGLGARYQTRELVDATSRARGGALAAFELLGVAAADQWSVSDTSGLTKFIGRAEEMARLRAAVLAHHARGTRPTALVVSGAAGVGKTRFVTEALARSARDPDRRVLAVRSQPTSRAPLALWAQVLQTVVVGMGGGGTRVEGVFDAGWSAMLAALPDEERDQLAVQRPVVDLLLGAGGSELLDEEDAGPGGGDRVEAAVAWTLRAAGAHAARLHGGRGLVLALENLHRADSASLDLLRRVLGHPALQAGALPAPVVILTSRHAGPVDPSAVCDTVPLQLGPLPSAEAGALAAALSDDAPISAAVRHFVARRSGGNPLFVEELIAGLRHRGLLGADPDRLRRFSAPTSLHGLILARFERLSPELREAARLASVLGVEFDAAVFRDVVDAAYDAETLPHAAPSARHLDELGALGVLTRLDDEGVERWAFSQAPFQSAVYSTVLTANRRLAHRLAGEAIERLHAGAIDRYVPELLEHYSHTDDSRRIVDYARRAGRQALALGSYRDAIEAFTMAQALEGRLQEASALPAASTKRDLAMAYVWTGHLGQGVDRAEQALAMIGPEVSRGGPHSAEALRVRADARMILAEVALHRGELEPSVAHARDAEADFRAAGRGVDVAEAQCWQGFALRTAGRVQEGLKLARAGWEVLRGAESLPVVARAGHDLGNVLRDVGEFAEAIAVFDRSIAAGDELHRLGRKTEALWGTIAARSGRAMTRSALGDVRGAIEDQRESRRRAIAVGNLPAQAYTGYHLASHLLDVGELDEAEATGQAALVVCERLGMVDRACRCRLVLARVSLQRDDTSGALKQLWRAEGKAQELEASAWLRVVEALVPLLVQRGDQHALGGLITAVHLRVDSGADAALRARAEVVLGVARALDGDGDDETFASDGEDARSALPSADDPTATWADFDES